MTREELMKRSWKAYQEINYQPPRMDIPVPCLLVSVDFDGEMMCLQPIPSMYAKDDFWANTLHCFVSKKKMEPAAIGGKIIKTSQESKLRHDQQELIDIENDPEYDDAAKNFTNENSAGIL